MNSPIPFYLAPATAEALLAKSRKYTEPRRAERANKAEVECTYKQARGLGWDDENARAMAEIKVYGAPRTQA